MKFEIVSDIEEIETIASGHGVKIRAHLQKAHGKGRWRKLRRVELHWYEAHGIGRRDFKIKAYLWS